MNNDNLLLPNPINGNGDKKKDKEKDTSKNEYQKRAEAALKKYNIPLASNTGGKRSPIIQPTQLTRRQRAGLDPIEPVKRTKPPQRGLEADDTGWDNFLEGLEQGTKGLISGAAFAGGEILDIFGAEDTGQAWKQWGRYYQASAPAPDNSSGQWWGSMVPSVVPSAAAVAAAPFTAGTSLEALPAIASISGLSLSSAGSGMMEYEQYKKSKGEEIDPITRDVVGSLYGLAEGIMERYALGKQLPTGTAKRLFEKIGGEGIAGKIFMKGDTKAAESVAKNVLEKFAAEQPKAYKQVAKNIATDFHAEGAEEFNTQVIQDAVKAYYEDSEDRKKTLYNIPASALQAYMGGAVMGSFIGPLSYGAQNAVNNKRRKAQGFVTLATNSEDGKAYELVEPVKNEKFEGFRGLSPGGEEVLIRKDNIGEHVTMSAAQFDKALQDKMDHKVFEAASREPVKMATFNGQDVRIKGEDGEGGYYITVPGKESAPDKDINVTEEQLSDFHTIFPKEQMAAEGNPFPEDQPVGPVEAVRDQQEAEQTQKPPKQGDTLFDEDGDVLYPEDERYAEELARQQQPSATDTQNAQQEGPQKEPNANSEPSDPEEAAAVSGDEPEATKPAAPPSELTIGTGKNRQKVVLQPQQDGSFTVSGRRSVDGEEVIEQATEDLTGAEIAELRKELETEYKGDGFEVVAERTDPTDPTSPKTLRVVPEGQQQAAVNQPTGLPEQSSQPEQNVFQREEAAPKEETPKVGNYNPAFKTSPKIEGDQETYTLPNGEQHKTQYAVVEADNIKPSHDAVNFTQSEDFPTLPDGSTPNDNDYQNNPDAQAFVANIAQNMDERIFQDVPVISTDGIVVSGNNRTMSLQRANRSGNQSAQFYKEELQKRAARFGINPEQLEDMDNPMLVRIDQDVQDYSTDTFKKFNVRTNKQKSDVEKAVVVSKSIDDHTVSRLVQILDPNSNGTIRESLDSPANARQAIQVLSGAGIIADTERAEYYDTKAGTITPRGKDFIELVSLGAILSPQAVRNTSVAGVKSFANKITYALPTLLEIKALGAEFDLSSELSQAVNFQRQIVEQGLTPRDAYAQQGLFEDSNIPPTVKFYHYLLDSGRSSFKQAVTIYAKAAKSGGNDMFSDSKRTRPQITNELFDYAQQQADPEQRATLQSIRQTDGNDARSERSQESGVQQEESPGDTGQRAGEATTESTEQQRAERGRHRINDLLEGNDVGPIEEDPAFAEGNENADNTDSTREPGTVYGQTKQYTDFEGPDGQPIGYVSVVQEDQQGDLFPDAGEDSEQSGAAGGALPSEQTQPIPQAPQEGRLPPEFYRVKRGYTPQAQWQLTGSSDKINNVADVAYLMRALETKAVEHVFAVAVDADGNATVLHVSTGGATATVVDADPFIDLADKTNPQTIYFVHNHPSGNLKRSEADLRMLKKLKRALPAIDIKAVIMNAYKGKYATFDLLSQSELDRPDQQGEVSYQVQSFDEQVYAEDVEIDKLTSPQEVTRFLTGTRYSVGDKLTALVLSNAKEVTAAIQLTSLSRDRITGDLAKYMAAYGGESVILAGRGTGLGPSDYVNINRNLTNGTLDDILQVDSSSENKDNFESLRHREFLKAPREIQRQMREPQLTVSESSFARQQLEKQLQQAQKEYRAARTAFTNKQKELQNTLDADRENLFGERKRSIDELLFDQRADPAQVDKALKPFRDRREVAKQQVNQLAKKLEQLDDTPQPGLFDDMRFSRLPGGQTDSEAFKEWFGNWELMQKETRIISISSDIKSIAKAKEAAAPFVGKKFTNKDTGEKISISQNAINKLFNEKAFNQSDDSRAHLNAAGSLPQLLEHSVLGEVHPDKNNDRNIEEIQRFYSAVKSSEEVYRIKTTVKKIKKEGQRFYTYEIEEMELLPERPIGYGKETDVAKGTPDTDTYSISMDKLLNGATKNNNEPFDTSYSKVVDEDGAPLVVYHGTNSDFNQFEGQEYYFTDDQDASKEYGYKAIPAYLSLKNPKIIDFEGRSDKDLIGFDVPEAIQEGYDGVIALNTYDGANTHNQYVAFRPDQIKSATGNKGSFDSNNPDIRYRQTADFVATNKPTAQAEKLRSEVETKINGWAGRDKIHVVSHPDHLPVSAQHRLRQEKGRIGGFFSGGRAYVLAYNLRSAEEAHKVLAHEAIGHLGIQGLIEKMSDNPQEFQDRFDQLREDVYQSFKEDDLFKKITTSYTLDMRTTKGRNEAAEEFIAHMAETGQEQSWVSKFVDLVNDILKKLAIKKGLTKTDIRNMLKDARKYVEEGPFVYDNGSLRPPFSLESYMNNWIPGPGEQKFKVLAWHGSPHVFNKFSSDNIGTGEGAQAFGWGLYFTDHEDIGRHYADILSQTNKFDFKIDGKEVPKSSFNIFKTYFLNPTNKLNWENLTLEELQEQAQEQLDLSYVESDVKSVREVDAAIDEMAKQILDANNFSVVAKKNRNLYKVTIHDGKEPGEYEWLDWGDRIPTEKYNNIENTWNLLHSHGINDSIEDWLNTWGDNAPPYMQKEPENMNGQELYATLTTLLSDKTENPKKVASFTLLQAGIDGIRYPANQGRSKGHNYVVFDDSVVSIDEHIRYSHLEDQTESKAFKRWFLGSKVTDKKGDPLVVYHGTPDSRGIREGFKSTKERLLGETDNQRVFFFSDQYSMAHSYADDRRAFDYQNATPETIDVYLSLRNPLIINAEGSSWNKFNYTDGNKTVTGTREIVKLAKDNDHDGIVIKNVRDNYNGNEEASPGTIYAVFNPTQIKSATGNKGSFDSNNPDIRFKKLDGPLEESDYEFKKRFDDALLRFQDYHLALKRQQGGVVDEGGSISDKSDAYQDETLAIGRTETQLKKLKRNHREPLYQQMNALQKEKGITYEDVDQFLKAKHAPERNKKLREMYPGKGDALSGMSTDKAEDILKEFDQKGWTQDLEAVAGRVYTVIRQTLDKKLSSGQITQADYNKRLKQFKNYVPLRGFKEFTEVDSTLFSDDHHMKGRTSESGPVVPYVFAMAETAIIKGEKNITKQHLARFAMDNPQRSDLMKVRNMYWRNTGEVDEETGKQKWEPTFEKPTTQDLLDGKAKRNLDYEKDTGTALGTEDSGNPLTKAERHLSVKIEGRPYVIEFKTPHIAQAFKKATIEDTSWLIKKVGAYTRFLRHVITQYSPEFGPRNFLRDTGEGFINMSIDHTAIHATKALNIARTGGLMKTVWKGLKGDYAGELGQSFKDFEALGAMSGHWELDDIKTRFENLTQAVNKGSIAKNPLQTTKDGIKKLGGMMEHYNETLENATRFSVYNYLMTNKLVNPKTKKPYTKKQAANYARNLTVNFNRKGQSSGVFGSMFLFFNAQVQGINRMAQPLFSDNKRTQWRAAAVPFVMAGSAQALIEILRASMGKDDDDEYYYDKINEWTRTHNFILPNPLSDDPADYIKIPMPYGYSAYWAAGDVANRYFNGATSVGDGLLELGAASLDSFNPVGTSSGGTFGTNVYKTMLPTVLKAGFELTSNENFAGSPIKPEPFPFGPKEPESQQYFPWTGKGYVALAKWLNEVSGGDEVTKGYADISPEYLEYLVGYYGGGTGQFISRLATFGPNVYDAVSGEDALEKQDMYTVPFAHSYYGVVTDGPTRREFYDHADAMDNLFYRYEGYMDNGDIEKARNLYDRNKGIMLLEPQLKAIKKQMRSLRKMQRAYQNRANNAEEKATRKQAKKQADDIGESIHQMHLEFNKMMNQAEKNKTKNPAVFLKNDKTEE